MGRHKKKVKIRHTNRRYANGGYRHFPRDRDRQPVWQEASGSHVSDDVQDLSENDKNEIPGFYFDPETKTYFRLTPENAKYFEQKRLNFQRKHSVTKCEQMKHGYGIRRSHFTSGGCLTSEIVHREYQNLSFIAFQRHVIGARLRMLKAVHRSGFTNEEFVPVHCQTMVGNPECGSVVGAWTTSVGTEVYNHLLDKTLEQNRSFQEESPVIGIHFQNVITDMCIAKVRDGLEFILYVGNPMRPRSDTSNTSTMHLFPVRQLCDFSTRENRMCIDSMSLNMEQNDSALWSCAWNQQTQGMAFGSEGSILLITLCHSPNYCEANLSLPKENVFSLEFNQSGNLLYSGVNKGNLKCFDLRTHKLASNIKLTRGLTYLKLLKSEEHIIASCYDHKLVQVDLRTQKVVVEYSGHHNEHLKIPLSVSEKNDFVCSVGQDKFIRIWNLKLGNQVFSIPPESDEKFHPYAWFSEEWQFGLGTTETALVVNLGDEFVTYKPQSLL